MASMRTEFGKAVGRIRLERGLLLMDVAKAIGVSPAFLSAVEFGRKPIPRDMVGKLVAALSLSDKEAAVLKAAEAKSARTVRIDLSGAPTADHGYVGAAFARKFPDLNADKLARLKKILEEEDD